jgi:hypothetical protein
VAYFWWLVWLAIWVGGQHYLFAPKMVRNGENKIKPII